MAARDQVGTTTCLTVEWASVSPSVKREEHPIPTSAPPGRPGVENASPRPLPGRSVPASPSSGPWHEGPDSQGRETGSLGFSFLPQRLPREPAAWPAQTGPHRLRSPAPLHLREGVGPGAVYLPPGVPGRAHSPSRSLQSLTPICPRPSIRAFTLTTPPAPRRRPGNRVLLALDGETESLSALGLGGGIRALPRAKPTSPREDPVSPRPRPRLTHVGRARPREPMGWMGWASMDAGQAPAISSGRDSGARPESVLEAGAGRGTKRERGALAGCLHPQSSLVGVWGEETRGAGTGPRRRWKPVPAQEKPGGRDGVGTGPRRPLEGRVPPPPSPGPADRGPLAYRLPGASSPEPGPGLECPATGPLQPDRGAALRGPPSPALPGGSAAARSPACTGPPPERRSRDGEMAPGLGSRPSGEPGGPPERQDRPVARRCPATRITAAPTPGTALGPWPWAPPTPRHPAPRPPRGGDRPGPAAPVPTRGEEDPHLRPLRGSAPRPAARLGRLGVSTRSPGLRSSRGERVGSASGARSPPPPAPRGRVSCPQSGEGGTGASTGRTSSRAGAGLRRQTIPGVPASCPLGASQRPRNGGATPPPARPGTRATPGCARDQDGRTRGSGSPHQLLAKFPSNDLPSPDPRWRGGRPSNVSRVRSERLPGAGLQLLTLSLRRLPVSWGREHQLLRVVEIK